jgi:dipeptidyl aminopeptidase/acylaminoacyl peptidase
VPRPAPVTPSDLGLFHDIGSVGLSADGALIAAVVSTADIDANRYQRVVITAPADASAVPSALPSGPGAAEMLPAWAPAGHDLATVRKDEDGWSIWRHALDDATSEPLLTGWPDPIEELSWSPGGDRLLFVAREPAERSWWELPEDRRPPLRITTLRYREDGVGWTVSRPRQGYVVPARPGGKARKISIGGHDDAEFGWHPDGHRVVFVSQRQPGADHTIVNDVYVHDIDADDAPVCLTSTTHACAQPRVSPDGKLVACTVTDVPRFPSVAEIAVLPVTGGPMTVVSAALDRDCNSPSAGMAGPIWDSAGGLTVLVDDAGAIHAYRLDPRASGQPELIAGGRRRVTSLAERNGTLGFVISGTDEPPHLVVRPRGGTDRIVLAPSAATAAARDLRAPVHRKVLAGDGTAIDSWLTLPDPGRWQAPHPLLLCLQGGGTQYGYQWSQEFQALTGAGFATLYLNPRGSAGYGNAWMRTVSGPAAATPGTGWGTVDVQDVLTVVRAVLAASGELDASHVGVQGGSYGGLVTTWLLADSDDFAAGWAERGPYNLVSLAGTNDESPWFFEAYLGRTVTDDPAAYWARSTLRLAAGITAPLAIMHSEEDRRCPIQQAEELFMALKLLGRDAEFIRFPGEGHGLSRTGSPVHRLQRLELLIEWFTRWLRPEARAQEGGAPVPDGAGPAEEGS